MTATNPRILVVDDEEAILETMAFTFDDDYEVLTSNDARKALDLLDAHAPVAAVLTDQRMPDMSGVEFVTEVCKRHPSTVRMILTGFSDMDAIIQAINDGHVYAYVTKPWEPEQLKQLMKQAVDHHHLMVENERLLAELRRANSFLEAVMDELDTGALALDAESTIQAVNRPVRQYLALSGDLHGRPLREVIERHGLEGVGEAAYRAAGDDEKCPQEIEIAVGERTHRLRITVRDLADADERIFGRVILFGEISHEPIQRRFEDALNALLRETGELRPVIGEALETLLALREEVEGSPVKTTSMSGLGERVSRTITALENWLDVDDTLAQQEFPDAQLLQDRMRVALSRWPRGDEVPERVGLLARRVEEYYESGENPRKPVL